MTSRFSHAADDDNVLSVQGDLDVYSVAEAIKQGCHLIDINESFTVIDLSQVEKIDSAGLAFVIELMKVARKQNKNLLFKNIPARMHAVADFYGLSEVIPDSAFQPS